MSAQKPIVKKPAKRFTWNVFDRSNYLIFLIGIGVIIVGYLAMTQGPYNSFLSLHLAPLLLVVGYCVLIPLAIMKRSKKPKGD
jgi:hypothetical protein